MKTLIISIVILAVVTAFTVFSAMWIIDQCEEMIFLSDRLPSEIPEEADTDSFIQICGEFSNQWEKTKKFFRLIFSHEDTEEIDDIFLDLKSRFLSGDNHGYRSSREKLISAFEELIRSEKATPYSMMQLCPEKIGKYSNNQINSVSPSERNSLFLVITCQPLSPDTENLFSIA